MENRTDTIESVVLAGSLFEGYRRETLACPKRRPTVGRQLVRGVFGFR
jgi:hypothetical protein